MEFWIVENGEKRGPFHSYELRDRIEQGDLSGDVLAWHKDRDDWVPLREMDVFRTEFAQPEPDPEAPPPDPVSPPQPLLRFWARWFDIFLYMTLVFGVLWMNGQSIEEANRSPVFGSLWFFPFLILEAISLHLYKTTPGKFLLGLRVVREDDTALPVGAALLRAVRVFILGMGCLIWLLPVVCHALCCWYTFKRGEAPWDSLSGSRVRSAGVLLVPVLLFVMFFMMILVILSLLLLPDALEAQKLRGPAGAAG